MKIYLTNVDILMKVQEMARKIEFMHPEGVLKLWAVPRGGIPVLYALLPYLNAPRIVDTWQEADVIIDDIIDSGKTRAKFPDKRFYAAVEKSDPSEWYIFPWEGDAVGSADDIVTRTLQFIGEDPTRDGLLETPKRVIKSWGELYAGYSMKPEEILSKQFVNEEKYDEMVISKNIDFCSMCEHHMLPFFGKAHIAYIPKDKIVGLSKLSRLVECYARRLQVQERMTQQIANDIQRYLDPLGVAVYIEGSHMCQQIRGIQKQNAVMVTSALKGAFERAEVRSEFLTLSKS